jgi:hypothetical protein
MHGRYSSYRKVLCSLSWRLKGDRSIMDIPISSQPREIGECIYCGTRRGALGKEHAVPYGLNGPWTLLKASCEPCAGVTHKFERDTMRSLWPELRNALAMQSRRRHQRSPTLPLIVQRNGVRETIQVPRSEFPVYLPTPLFPPPAVMWRSSPIRGVFTNLDSIHIAGPTFKEASERYPGAEFVGAHTNFSPEEFARTIAKIAYCAAVSAIGIGAFTNTPIRGIILGTDPCIGHWVGSWHGAPENEMHKGLHAIKVRSSVDSVIHVIVGLFAQFGAPEYHVVLGRADAAFVASSQWPWR